MDLPLLHQKYEKVGTRTSFLGHSLTFVGLFMYRHGYLPGFIVEVFHIPLVESHQKRRQVLLLHLV